MEIRRQAPHNRTIRECVRTNGQAIRRRRPNTASHGIDEGIHRQVDPDGAAGFIPTATNGNSLQRATTEGIGDVASARAELDAWLKTRLPRER